MAITQVRAQVNGTWYTLAYDSASGSYKATVTAPGATSYNQAGGYYNVAVEASNDAGTKVTVDGSAIAGLRLVVKERVAPVITILSPSTGAYVSNSKQPVVFNITDEDGGSGVDLNSVVVKLDGTEVAASAVTHTAISGGYSFTHTPGSAMSDGSHTVVISASDNDGNAATDKSTTFTVDTVPPTLNVTAPSDGLVTNSNSVTVKGTTNDATSSPVTITITLNGVDQGDVTVSNGSFSKVLTLAEGSNAVQVTATDAAGKTSTVTRTITLDTSVPTIQSAAITPNPADAGATVVVSVVIV